MAKQYPRENEEFSDFYSRANRTRELIVLKFDSIMLVLISRKEELLREVERIEELHRKEERLLENEMFLIHSSRKDSWIHVDTPADQGIATIQESSFSVPHPKPDINVEESQRYAEALVRAQTAKKLIFRWLDEPVLRLITQLGEISYSSPTVEKDSEPEVIPVENDYYQSVRMPIRSVGKNGEEEELHEPRDIAIDPATGNIFIADSGHHRVDVYSALFNFRYHIGKEEGAGKMNQPWGLSIYRDTLFVTQWWSHCVKAYSISSGACQRKIGHFGNGLGEFSFPEGIAISEGGDLFVCDSKNNRLQVFTPELQFVQEFGETHLESPRCVRIPPSSDDVIVLDHNTRCVHLFSRGGDLKADIITQGTDAQVHDPYFFFVDHWLNLIVSDRLNHCLRVFDAEGNLMHTIGKEGFNVGEFNYPMGICSRRDGGLITACLKNEGCIQFY